MKKYMVIVVGMATSIAAQTGFKSTQEAMDAIFNTYNTLLQTPNLYDKSVSFNELVQLGDRLNAHIMKKQGLLLGSKTKRNDPLRSFKDSYNNIFDLWEDQIFRALTDLVNALKIIRATKAKDAAASTLINNLHTNNALIGMIEYAKTIRSNTLLNDKKKIADIIIFLTEQNKELVAKAVTDLKNI